MKHISEFVRQCTDALSNDPEVQLEIEQELRDHLECRAAEEQSNGMSEEASEELAIKSFGDAPEISESLYDSNVHRMKQHAKIRLFIKVAAIPALLIALYFSFDYRNIIFWWNLDDFLTGKRFNHTDDHLNDEQKLIVNGDTTEKNKADQQKAIWERWPDNKIYMANYISYLINDFKGTNSKFTQEYMLKELRKAESLEPENAFYNYMAAVVLLKNAAKIELKRIKFPGKKKKEIDVTLKNRKLFDCAMREFKAGIQKPYCREYVVEMAIQRANIVSPNSDTLRKKLQRFSITASALLPFLSEYRHIGRALAYYARLQAKAGNKKEAEFYLNAWKPYVRQLNNGADTLIGILVANAIIRRQQVSVPEIYQILGEPRKAKSSAEELKRATAVINKWKKTKTDSKQLKRKGGIFACMFLPALRETPDDKILTPGRNLDYIMAEKIIMAVMSVVGLTIIVFTLIFMGWNYWRGKRSFIFVPSLRDLTKIIGWGIVVPLAIYIIISRTPLLSGREYNILLNLGLFLIQIIIFILGIPTAMVLAVSSFVRRRCRRAGIDVPPKSIWLSNILISFPVIAVLLIWNINSNLDQIDFPFKSAWITVMLAPVTLIIIIAPLFRLMFMKKKYSRYKMTLYVNLISPIVLMMLAVSVIVRPYLDHEEIRFIKEDKCIFFGEGYTSIEEQVMEKLRDRLTKVLNKLPVETK